MCPLVSNQLHRRWIKHTQMAIACIFCYILGSYNMFDFYGDMHNMYHSSLSEDDVVVFSSYHKHRRLAVANFIGQSGTAQADDLLYGVYSIHQQLIKYNMIHNNTNEEGVTHVAIVVNSTKQEHIDILTTWLGKENIKIVFNDYIMDRISSKQGLWKGVFGKLHYFNLTEFDKVISL